MPTRCAGLLPATLRPPVRPAVTAQLEPVALALPGRASRTSAPPPSGSGPRPTASRYRHEAGSRRASSTSSALRATDRAPRAAARRGGDANPPAEPGGRRRDPAAPTGEGGAADAALRSEEHTSELQSRQYLVCRLLLEKKKNIKNCYTVF